MSRHIDVISGSDSRYLHIFNLALTPITVSVGKRQLTIGSEREETLSTQNESIRLDNPNGMLNVSDILQRI